MICGGGEVVAASQSTNLVAAYGFEEGNGSVLVDVSGNGNNGTVNRPAWVAGHFGTALELDGAGVLVTIGDSSSLDLTTGMTLEAWIYPTAAKAGWTDLIYKGLNDIYYLALRDGLPATSGTFSQSPVLGPARLPLNEWSHLAATYDGASLGLFVNGVLVASRQQKGVIATSPGPLSLGGDNLYGQYWVGRIDDVRIYNRALALEEIQADMNTPVAGPPADATPPTVSLTSPGQGSTVSQVVAISASAADDVGVAGVEFFADGVSLGADVSAPYSIRWNTTSASNGLHVLTVVARDDFGNQSTSAPVVVTAVNPAFVNETIVPGIVSATTLAFLPDGRMVVGELTETVWVVQPGASSPDAAPFLELDGTGLFGEQGLMDLILDPGFATNGYYYVFYTCGFTGQGNRDRVSRFTASGNGTIAGSEAVLWQDNVIAEEEHHGGAIAFGIDGKLYIALGDQFNAADAQSLGSYHGKILRINADGSIPADNPFQDGPGPNLDEIWALGLRNPFRMSVDEITGRMFIGDVGGNDYSTAVEEINLGVRGANYGWPLCEGACADPALTKPLFSYRHNGRDACVVGGFVYRGRQFPAEYYGSYFFADYVQNWIKRLTFETNGDLALPLEFEPPDGAPDGPYGDPVKLVEGPDGSLYYIDIGFNDSHVPNPATIRRIRYVVDNRPPAAAAAADPVLGLPPLTVTFSSAGSSDPEGRQLTYSWAFGDGTTSTDETPLHTYQTAGDYVARLTVSDGVSTALSGDVRITVGTPPTAVILSPTDGSTFRAGDTIQFSGTGTDADDGLLPASAFSWTIVFHHANHLHPGGGVTNTDTGTLLIPTSGHDFSGATSYEIILSLVNSIGLRGSTSVMVFPEKIAFGIDTAPGGLAIDVDGIRRIAPFVLDDVIGFQHSITAPHQSSGGTNYYFQSWSDGGLQTHLITMPELDDGLVASYGTALPAPVIASSAWIEGRFHLSFSSTAEEFYRIERSDSLEAGGWVPLLDQVPGTGQLVEAVDDSAAAVEHRFYRVLLLPDSVSTNPPGHP